MSAIETALAESRAKIGQEVGVSRWILVDQQMIDEFAATTRDDQWIHVNPERARAESPYGGTIAHGFLTLSLASRFSYDCFSMLPGQVMGINYGFEKLRFLSPVKSGSRLRGRFVLQEATLRSEIELLRRKHLTIEIENHDKPALVAEWLGLSVFAPPQ